MNSARYFQFLSEYNEIRRQKLRFARTNRNKKQSQRIRRKKRQDVTTKENIGKLELQLYKTN